MTRYLNAVQLMQGDPTLNPFRALRTTGRFVLEKNKGADLVEEVTVGMTLQELADAAGISKQALIRTEQGAFADPPSRIVDYWTIRRGVSYTTIVNGYFKFIKDTRSRHYRLFGNELPLPPNVTEHPLKFLRSHWYNPIDGQLLGHMNITELAKLLCINQSIPDYFEKHAKRQVTVPTVILTALKDNGYRNSEIDAFILSYKAYRDNLLGVSQGLTPVGSQPVRINPNTPVGRVVMGDFND